MAQNFKSPKMNSQNWEMQCFKTLKFHDSFKLSFLLNIQSHQLVVFNKIFQMLCCTLQLEII
jgi:hypothetical protein